MNRRFCCVGAGFSGAVLARTLAEAGFPVLVAEERGHVAGNCHTERDAATGVMVHRYGPHIFHTANEQVWSYVNRFAAFRPYINRVKAVVGGRMFTLPINLLTLNQFFGRVMGPDEARAWLASEARDDITNPANFEEQALALVGERLYRAFFEGYTRKQWGREPRELPAAILKRLPVRFSYDDNYFDHPHQGIPEGGYTALVGGILDHPAIEVRLSCRFEALEESFRHVFWSGPLDRWFACRAGRLDYRTLDFERIERDGDFQGTAVINWCDEAVPWTRSVEHKHFAPWEATELPRTVVFRERSRAAGAEDTPFYPVRLAEGEARLATYRAMAAATRGVSFLGRLGTFRYLDMDVTIAQALAAGKEVLACLREERPIPPFLAGASV